MRDVYLFHLHFYVMDPKQAESAFVEHLGMNVVGRAGLIGSEQVVFAPAAGWDAIAEAGARFRQTQLQRGAFDLILGPGQHPEPRLEHFGMRVDEETYERCKATFVTQGLPFREGERRSFFTTPFGIRMELVAPHHSGQVPYMDTDYATLRIATIRFAVTDPPHCEQFFSDVLGHNILNQLEFETAHDGSSFRPVEVRLSSSGRADNTAMEMMPKMQWVF